MYIGGGLMVAACIGAVVALIVALIVVTVQLFGRVGRYAFGSPVQPTTHTPGGRLVWIDLETCGLDRDSPILEIAIVVTDNDLNVVATFERVAHYTRSTLDAWLSDHVCTMHTTNGLLDDVRHKGLHPVRVQQSAIEFLDRHAPPVEVLNADGTTQVVKPKLCGSSVHADRRWLEFSMPRLERRFHHQHLDATSLKIAAGLLGVTDFGPRDEFATHRAMPDILESIRLAKYARDYGTGLRAVWLHVKAIGRVLRRMIGGAS